MTTSHVVSRTQVGDTTVTVFVVGTNTAVGATVDIANVSKISFPYASASICDPATSSYGPGTWDSPCRPAAQPVRVVAKTWINAQGKAATDFEPALRFVPGLRWPVQLYFKHAAGVEAGDVIVYCTRRGCVDEALADPSLSTNFSSSNGWVWRNIKHFSGYTVVANRSYAY